MHHAFTPAAEGHRSPLPYPEPERGRHRTMRAPIPDNEAARLDALHRYAILDTPPEEAFDDIVTLAAHICNTPIALITFVDTNRQWFKARLGLDAAESSRDVSFCAHAILKPDDVLVVPDALEDPRFAGNPLVTATPKIRFYAGAPLVTHDGHSLGTLCVIDRVPRRLTEEQLAALRALRRDVITELELRRSITERDQARTALQRLNVELEAANQELQSFNFSVSHDLRAPLTIIDGFSKALLEDYATCLDQQGRDYLGRIRTATQRMTHLIDALLNLSRLSRDPLNREPTDLTEIARTIERELRYLNSGQRRVTMRISDGITAKGDRLLLRSLIENLLGNAWKYTRQREEAVIEFGVTEEEGKTVYYVRDNGAGFDMKYAGRLFAPFQRMHRPEEFEGIGVGLAIAQRVVRRHGGRIWVEAEPDKGATFFFTLE